MACLGWGISTPLSEFLDGRHVFCHLYWGQTKNDSTAGEFPWPVNCKEIEDNLCM